MFWIVSVLVCVLFGEIVILKITFLARREKLQGRGGLRKEIIKYNKNPKKEQVSGFSLSEITSASWQKSDFIPFKRKHSQDMRSKRDLISLTAVIVPPKGDTVYWLHPWRLRRSSHIRAQIHDSSKGLALTPGLLNFKPFCIMIHTSDDCQVSTSGLIWYLRGENKRFRFGPQILWSKMFYFPDLWAEGWDKTVT